MTKDSIISILYDLKNKGLFIIFPIVVFMTVWFIVDSYKDKHNECRIFSNNLKSQFSMDTIIAIDSINLSAYIGYYDNKPNVYLKLDKLFIKNIHVGDSVHKFRGENVVWIYKGKSKIELPFAEVPIKECKN